MSMHINDWRFLILDRQNKNAKLKHYTVWCDVFIFAGFTMWNTYGFQKLVKPKVLRQDGMSWDPN